MIIVKAKIKDLVQEDGGFNVSADFADKLDEKVKMMVKEACQRAKENSRRTVMARDL